MMQARSDVADPCDRFEILQNPAVNTLNLARTLVSTTMLAITTPAMISPIVRIRLTASIIALLHPLLGDQELT